MRWPKSKCGGVCDGVTLPRLPTCTQSAIMPSHLIKLAILLVLLPGVEAQLHLISGTENPKGATAYVFDLLRVAGGGSIEQVQSLTRPDVGVESVHVSFDLRKAVLLTKAPSHLVVVDFDQALVAKECEVPSVPNMQSLISQWLVNVPTVGAMFEQHLGEADLTKDVVQSMTLDSAVECGRSFAISDAADLKHIHTQGYSTPVSINSNGVITAWFLARPIALETVVPASLVRDLDLNGSGFSIMVNDFRLLVLSVTETGARKLILIYRKQNRDWKRVRVNDSAGQIVRGFGRYLGIAETRPRKSASDEMPGRAAWRTKESKRGPTSDEWFGPLGMPMGGQLLLAGVLHLYDSETERMYKIVTNQADSEIILVDNGLVYYRVADRLFSAPIEERKLGAPKLLAAGEDIRDAHWAFMKRASNQP